MTSINSPKISENQETKEGNLKTKPLDMSMP